MLVHLGLVSNFLKLINGFTVGAVFMKNLIMHPDVIVIPASLALRGYLDNVMSYLSSSFLNINGCPQLLPLMASWMFLLSVLLWCFPVVGEHLHPPRVWRHCKLLCRLVAPWPLFHLLWAPYNRLLLLLLRDVLQMHACTINTWLPFLSFITASFLLYSSWTWCHTASHLQPLRLMSVMMSHHKEHNVRHLARRTRSGRVFGYWS